MIVNLKKDICIDDFVLSNGEPLSVLLSEIHLIISDSFKEISIYRQQHEDFIKSDGLSFLETIEGNFCELDNKLNNIK